MEGDEGPSQQLEHETNSDEPSQQEEREEEKDEKEEEEGEEEVQEGGEVGAQLSHCAPGETESQSP